MPQGGGPPIRVRADLTAPVGKDHRVHQPPDLVMIMTDQQRHDHLGWRGVVPVRTPTLDRLARDGVAFTDAYSASTTCVPSRTALLTGVLDHRLPRDGMHLVPGVATVPRALREMGYWSAQVGKAHFHPLHADHGFDLLQVCEHLDSYAGGLDPKAAGEDYRVWLDARGLPDERIGGSAVPWPDPTTHPTTWVRDRALEVLSSRDPDRPLHLVVSFPHPHPPIDPPEPYATMYRPEDCVIDPDGAASNRYLPHSFREATAQADHPHRRIDPDRLAHHQAEMARTFGLVTQVDDAVADVLDALDLDRTLVAFTSDHGDYGGHRGLIRKVPWIPFDDLARVALSFTGVGVSGGRVVDAPVQSFDIAATFLAAAGVALDERDLDAVDLGPVLADPTVEPPTDRLVHSAVTMGYPMVRRGPHKYIRDGWGSEVLLDVVRDPDEVWDVSKFPGGEEIKTDLAAAVDAQLAAPAVPTEGV